MCLPHRQGGRGLTPLSEPLVAPHALIAGAGIGGLTAALGLARRGWRITLLERRDGHEDIGAGLQISPNASAILRDLGLLPQLIASGLAPTAVHIRRAKDGATLARLPLGDAEQRWGAPYLDVHRADLIGALRAAALAEPNIAFHPQTALAGFEQTFDSVSAVALRRALRVSFSADCLIGADGVRSFVRARTATLDAHTDDLPKLAHYVAWRALVPADRVAAAWRVAESTLWLGPGAHLVHYPLRGGSVINLVAIVDAAWPLDAKADLWSQPGDPAVIAARFSRWAAPARALVAAATDWRLWPQSNARRRRIGTTAASPCSAMRRMPWCRFSHKAPPKPSKMPPRSRLSLRPAAIFPPRSPPIARRGWRGRRGSKANRVSRRAAITCAGLPRLCATPPCGCSARRGS